MNRTWRVSYLILAICITHLVWATILLFSDAPLHVTSMAEVPWNFSPYFASFVYSSTAILAIYGMFSKRFANSPLSVAFIIPQQALLLYGASTVLKCVIRGSYADGTVVPYAHLWADQQYVFTNSILHSIALIDWHFFAPKKAVIKYSEVLESIKNG